MSLSPKRDIGSRNLIMADAELRAVVHHLRHMAAPGGVGALNDAQLLHRFVQTRDEAAFEVLVWRHGGLVLGVCRNLLHNEQDAEDAFQATFFTFARRPPAIAKDASLAGWLHKVSCRIALRILAQSRRRRTREHHDVDPAALVANAQQGAGATIEQRELWGMVIEELHRLPDSYRRPIISYYLEGKTYEEVARELRRPLGSMSRLLGRGCEMLSVRLTRRGVALPASLVAVAIADSARATLLPAVVVPVVTAALQFSAGIAVSGRAPGFAKWALTSIILSKVKIPGGILLALCAIVAGTAGLAGRAQTELAGQLKAVERQEQPPLSAQKPQARTDLYGDPLPAGAFARFGSIRGRHAGLSDFVFLRDGSTILSVGSNNELRFWELATGEQVRAVKLQGTVKTGGAFTLSPDGNTVVERAKGSLIF
jgi:RNA polymerase sigma factor (sigma-70 family)